MPIDALSVLCAQLTRDLLAIAKFLLDWFFWKLPQFHTSNFRKVVQQHTECMVGSIIWVLLEIYFPAVK